MLEELTRPHVVGAKQVRRALASGKAAKLFIATDADPALTDPLLRQAQELGVPADSSAAMRELGRACGIAVGAAVAAVLA